MIENNQNSQVNPDNTDLESQLKTLTASANKDAKNYEKRISSLEKENVALNEKLAQTEANYKEAKAAEKAKQKEIDKYKKMSDDLTTTLSGNVSNKVLKQFLGLQVKLDDALDSLESANRDVKLLEQVNDDAASKIASLTNEVNELMAEKAALSQQALEALKKDPDIVNKNARLEQANQELLDQLAALQKYATEKENEAEQLKSERVNDVQENEIIKNTLINQENSIDTLTETLTDTMARYEALRQDNQKGKEERENISDELYQTNQKLKEALNKVHSLEEQLNTLQKDNDDLKEKNQEVNDLYDTSMDEKTRSLSEALAVQMALKKSQEELTETQEQNKELAESAEQNALLYKEAQIKLVSLEQERNDRNLLMDKQLTDLALIKQENDSLKGTNNQLNQDILAQGQAYQTWKEQFDLEYSASLKAIDTLKKQQAHASVDKDKKIKELEEKIEQILKEKSLYDAGRYYFVSDEAIPVEIKQGFDTLNPDYYSKSQFMEIIKALQEENVALREQQESNVTPNIDTMSLEEENKNLKMAYIESVNYERLIAENDILRETLKEYLPLDKKCDELSQTISNISKELDTLSHNYDNQTAVILTMHPEYMDEVKALEHAETSLNQKIVEEGKDYNAKLEAAVREEEQAEIEKNYQSFLALKDKELADLALQQKDLLAQKEALLANNNDLLALNNQITALKKQKESLEVTLEAYLNKELNSQKKELLTDYQEKVLKQSQLHTELRKRESFLKALRASNKTIRDYVLVSFDYNHTDNEADKNVLYSTMTRLSQSDDVKVYQQISDQVTVLSQASTTLLEECNAIRKAYKAA